MRFVRVEWLDAVSRIRWHSPRDVDSMRAEVCISCGILAAEEKDSITISNTYRDDPDETWGDTLTIVRGSIKTLEILREE